MHFGEHNQNHFYKTFLLNFSKGEKVWAHSRRWPWTFNLRSSWNTSFWEMHLSCSNEIQKLQGFLLYFSMIGEKVWAGSAFGSRLIFILMMGDDGLTTVSAKVLTSTWIQKPGLPTSSTWAWKPVGSPHMPLLWCLSAGSNGKINVQRPMAFCPRGPCCLLAATVVRPGYTLSEAWSGVNWADLMAA